MPFAVLSVALALAATPAAAQQRDLTTDAVLRSTPGGVVLATMPAGAPVTPGRTRDDWREATLEGWIFTASTERTSRGGFDRVVSVSDGENLRASPNGEIIARLETGMLLHQLDTRGGWTRVRRTGWVLGSTLGGSRASQPVATDKAPPRRTAAPTAPLATTRSPEPPAPGEERVEAVREVAIFAMPDSQQVGMLGDGAGARVVARAGEWVRVRVDGWVRASDLRPAPETVPATVTIAELRANPEKYVGTTVDWRVQLIAVQIADELRTEMAQGQPYLLTRGPLPESGFVYVMIPKDQVERFRALPPLQELTVRAVIRAPRTRYLATPVVELVEVRSGV